MDEVEGGWKRLGWAMGGLRLVAVTRWKSLVLDLYHNGWPAAVALILVAAFVLLLALVSTGNAIGALIVAGLTGLGFWSGWRRHPMVVLLSFLTFLMVMLISASFRLGQSDLGRVVFFAVLIGVVSAGALSWAVPQLRSAAHRSKTLFAAICLAAFVAMVATIGLVATIGGPASGFVVASSRDHAAAEAVLSRVGALDPAQTNTTTAATLLGVVGSAPVVDGPPSADVSTKYSTTVQGYDLAGGVFPQAAVIGFSDLVPPGATLQVGSRLLGFHDAGSLNVLVADDGLYNGPDAVRPLPGSTITVLGRDGGTPLTLHVVGWFDHDRSSSHVFGDILADDGVVMALSGGQPTYTYGLRADVLSRAVAFAALRLGVPRVQALTIGDEPAGITGSLLAILEEGAQMALLSAVIVLTAETGLRRRPHETPAAGR